MNKSTYLSTIDDIANLTHEKFKEIYQEKNNGSRIKITKDKLWIKKHGTDSADLAKLNYHEVPEDWKKERWLGAKTALDELLKTAEKGEYFDAKFIEYASDIVHEDWLTRNVGIAKDEHKLSYGELSENAKEKDRIFVYSAIEIHKKMQSENISKNLSPSKEVETIGKNYLKHEFRKIFGDIDNENVWKEINKSTNTFLKREGEESFWNLLFGISEGWKIKYVAQTLSDTKYKWKLQNFSLEKITLTGMSPLIDKYTIAKCARNPLFFGELWEKDSAMRKEITASGFSEHKERDSDPILICQRNGDFHVFDGMRRTLLASIQKDKKIKAWVGYEINKKGQPLVSVSRCLFLADLINLSKKDPVLQTAIIKIGKQITKNYRNGRKTLIERIANWSHNPDIKETFKEL